MKEFVKTCAVRAHAKVTHRRPYGLLRSIPIPSLPWASISMDFIFGLPPVSGHDAMLVIVERFSKMAHIVPCSKTIWGKKQHSFF